MQQAGWTGLAVALSLLGWAGAVSAQEQTQYPSGGLQGEPPVGAPPLFSAPAASPVVAAPAFEPAPIPSHPKAPSDSSSIQSGANNKGPLAPGSMRLRINGQLTTSFGAYSDSGRSGR